jgi:hypothetical protein
MRGEGCAYAHGEEDRAKTINLRKTVICRGWKNAQCKWTASECPFAHGHCQLRTRTIESDVDSLASMNRAMDVRSLDEPMHVSSTFCTSRGYGPRILKFEPLHLPIPSLDLDEDLWNDVVHSSRNLSDV